jgi:hypothetical protein
MILAALIPAAVCRADDGGPDRDVSLHVLVGLVPDSGFRVTVDGDSLASGPVFSNGLGIVSYEIDDTNLPPGPHEVVVVPSSLERLEISDLAVLDVGTTWALVGWETNRPATSQVEYGPDAGYGSSTAVLGEMVVEHQVVLDGLLENTLYHFRAISVDEFHVTAFSPDSTFTTMSSQQYGPPLLDQVVVTETTLFSVTVSWVTDRPATSQVEYGVGGELDLSTPVDSLLVENHEVVVSPIAPGQVYSVRAVSESGGERGESDTQTFCAGLPEGSGADPRELSLLRVEMCVLDPDSAVVGWVTDRPCSSWVEFGETDRYGRASTGFEVGECGYMAALAPLTPLTAYHYRICAVDPVGGPFAGPDLVFETPRPDDWKPPAPPLPAPGAAIAAYPNPTSGAAVMVFALSPQQIQLGERASLRIVGPSGRLVRELPGADCRAGPQTVVWDGRDDRGQTVASGVYFCEVATAGLTSRKKLTVVR